MTAWQLAQRGHTVTVFDQWNTPNDRGASAGESRIFRTLYKEGPEYVAFIQRSGQKWKELEAAQETQVLEWCGGLTIGRPDHPDVTAVLECADELGLDHRVLDAAAMREEFPAYGVDDDEIGVLDPNAGVFRPELAVLAARDESIRLGRDVPALHRGPPHPAVPRPHHGAHGRGLGRLRRRRPRDGTMGWRPVRPRRRCHPQQAAGGKLVPGQGPRSPRA